ncbi:MAG: hypothetical protein K8S22_21290, partial [Betaproteobacteria bacterium]|nr:hypothetical protein [Betaproteobacteria bacterium]
MDNPPATSRRPTGAILAGSGFGIALASGVAALLAGLGVRWGWWDYRSGFLILRIAVWSAMAAAAISVYAIVVALRDRQRR